MNNIKHLKKIACFKCEKRVESECQLFEHSRTHLDYPVSCVYCRCTFRSDKDYDGHDVSDCKRQFSKNGPGSALQKYVCTVCHAAFANKKTFQSHLLVSHGTKLYNNWYGCKLCREMFEQKKTLYHHYKHVHSDSKCPWESKSISQETEENTLETLPLPVIFALRNNYPPTYLPTYTLLTVYHFLYRRRTPLLMPAFLYTTYYY